MRLHLFVSCFFMSLVTFGQVAPDKYFISFTDKTGTPYSINYPQAFLSQRAIDRRNNQGIPIKENDLPVNPEYVYAVKNIGVTILNVTKWLNGVTIYTTDPSKITQIQSLPFVSGVMKSTGAGGIPEPQPDKFAFEKPHTAISSGNKSVMSGYNYGNSFNQIHMLNGDLLHNDGYRGQGMVIAILDGGFQNANILPAFDSLRIEGRLLGTKDFVLPGGNVFEPTIAAHGTMVLSTMAGNLPGQLIGTAPKASYWLLRSEDAEPGHEDLIEEFNWVSAAEYADSVGADIINSSLGYTTFNDTTYSHSCADMNGHTTPVTRGANIAADKGIAVINSAGNSGGSAWTCVGAPSDGDSVMAIGAVDAFGMYAFFSSVGVDTAGRVKPNVSAQGMEVYVCGGEGAIVQSSGTSFSSPIIAGMVACLWQAQPTRSRTDILSSMERSASQYDHPDSLIGYGIPDFVKALTILGVPHKKMNFSITTYPNPFTDALSLEVNGTDTGDARVDLYDMLGRKSMEWGINIKSTGNIFTLQPGNLPQGVYLLTVTAGDTHSSVRIIKR